MEYVQFVETVGRIKTPDLDEVYGDLMSNEANTLRIIERVAADTRRDTIQSNDVWNMSLKRLLNEFGDFWLQSYVHVMKKENSLLKQRLMSPMGRFYLGLTVFVLVSIILVCT